MNFPDNIYLSFESVAINTASEKTVIIEIAGMSAFLDFDESVDTKAVMYTSSNSNVVFPNDGRLLATGIGEAVVQVTYKDFSEYITVIVERQFDKIALQNYLSEHESKSLRPLADDPNIDARMEITAKGRAMAFQAWKPTKDLVMWGPRNGTWKYFPKDVYQFGIPYTQATYHDEISFLNKMSASDFYIPNESIITNTGRKMCPQYGSDCSAFVSYAWGISRINTKTFYDRIVNGTYKKLSSYSQLYQGDAVVIPDNHMFLIQHNFEVPASGGESYVACLEQTPPQASDTFWTYSQLQSSGYTPFSKFK